MNQHEKICAEIEEWGKGLPDLVEEEFQGIRVTLEQCIGEIVADMVCREAKMQSSAREVLNHFRWDTIKERKFVVKGVTIEPGDEFLD